MKRKEALTLPTHVDLVVDVDGGGKCNFKYRETFPDEKLVARTAVMLQAAANAGALPPNVHFQRSGPKALELKGKNVARKDVGNMLFGEFLMWSTIGDMTLRDLVGVSVRLGQMTAGKTKR